MNCSIDNLRSCQLWSTFTPSLDEKETMAFSDTVLQHRVHIRETYYVTIAEKYRRIYLPNHRLSFIDQLKQSSFSFREKSVIRWQSLTATRHRQNALGRSGPPNTEKRRRGYSISRWCITGWKLLQVLHRQNWTDQEGNWRGFRNRLCLQPRFSSFSKFQPTTAKQLEDPIAAAPKKHFLFDRLHRCW